MKPHIHALIAVSLWASIHPTFAQGTAFTYQGKLSVGTNPATGSFDLKFSLYDSAASGNQVAGPLTNAAVSISNGLFALSLDFGAGAFGGADRWLDIAARTNGSGAFTPLSPRQKLTPAPYAITAQNLDGPLPSGQLAGTYGNPINLNNGNNSFAGNGAGLTGVNATTLGGLNAGSFWKLLGNSGTAGTNFLGTADNSALELKVNGARALRLEPNGASPNVIGGYNANSVAGGTYGATIAGGGASGAANTVAGTFGTVGGGYGNSASGPGSFIGGGGSDGTTPKGNSCAGAASSIDGGMGNSIGIVGLPPDASAYCSIGGGSSNTMASFNASCTIAGGANNSINGGGMATSPFCTIGGGNGNSLGFSNEGATIAGGAMNGMGYLVQYSTIGGGLSNSITGQGFYSTISGGWSNTIAMVTVNGARGTTISGGISNYAGGLGSTIAGGLGNSVTADLSFAAGHRAKANHAGCFVWADSTEADFSSAITNSVIFRCSGGVGFYSGAGGGNQQVTWSPGSGSWSFSSDCNLKEAVKAVDCQAVLNKLSELPVSEWNYKGYPQRHIGAMAQDFHALFPLNESETTLNSADLDGVALAAIKGLNSKVDDQNAALEEQLKAKDREIQELKRRLDAMEKFISHAPGGAN